MAFEMIKWHNMFKRDLFVDGFDILVVAITVIIEGIGILRWLTLCYDELGYSKSNPIVEANQALFGNVSVVTDSKIGFDPAFDVVYIVAILYNAFQSYLIAIRDGPFNFDFSLNLAQGITRLLMFLDKVVSIGIVTPKKPWARFLGF